MKHSIIFILTCLTIFSGCATKRDFMYLDDRLKDIERYRIDAAKEKAELESRLQALDQSQDNVDQGARTQYASVKSEINSLKQELRTINGRIDELHHLLGNLDASSKSLEKAISRLDEKTTKQTDRVLRLEEYLGFEQSRPGPDATGSAPVIKKTMPADEIYNRAKASFDKNRFEPARIGFRQFISKYPDSKNADNALFWIGETFFRQKQYKKAILEYQKVIETYPRGNKVAAALLKQGLAFNHIGERANAKLILKELVRRFPTSKESDIARTNLKKMN